MLADHSRKPNALFPLHLGARSNPCNPAAHTHLPRSIALLHCAWLRCVSWSRCSAQGNVSCRGASSSCVQRWTTWWLPDRHVSDGWLLCKRLVCYLFRCNIINVVTARNAVGSTSSGRPRGKVSMAGPSKGPATWAADAHDRTSMPKNILTSSNTNQLTPAAGASFIMLGSTPCERACVTAETEHHQIHRDHNMLWQQQH